MGGHASVQVRSGGKTALLLGLALLWGQQSPSEGRQGRGWWDAGEHGGDGGKETEGEKGEGEPSAQGDQTGNVVLPLQGRGTAGRQRQEPWRRVLRCARQEMGAGHGVPSGREARRLMGFREPNLE